MEVMPDHVHLFIGLDPRMGVHKVIKSLKGRSARILRSEFPSLKTRLPNKSTSWIRNVTSRRAACQALFWNWRSASVRNF